MKRPWPTRLALLMTLTLAACGAGSKDGQSATAGAGGGGAPGAAGAVDAAAGAGGEGDAAAASCAEPSAKQVWGRQLFDHTVYAVAVLAGNDIWRGDDLALWHWDGGTWSRIFMQTSGYYFDGLLAFGAHDVWALGDMRLRQWDGEVWRDRAPPFAARTVWGPRSSDLWALAVVPMSTPNRTTTLHWDGVGWTERGLPAPAEAGAAVVMNSIWGAAPDDVWAVGHTLRPAAAGFGAAAMHWNGAAWSETGDSRATERASRDFLAVGGLSSDDVWAVAAGADAPGGELWHLANGVWAKTVALPVRKDLQQTVQHAVFWSGCPGTLWLATGGFVSSYDGARWAPFAKLPSTFLFAVSGLGNQVWIAGNGTSDQAGALLSNAPDGPASCGNARLDPGEQCDPPDDLTCTTSCQTR